MSIFKPVTVVTGASAGIGAELARVFAHNGHEVALVARREKEMVLIANDIAVSAKYKPHVIVVDLQRSDAPARRRRKGGKRRYVGHDPEKWVPVFG